MHSSLEVPPQAELGGRLFHIIKNMGPNFMIWATQQLTAMIHDSYSSLKKQKQSRDLDFV